MGEVHELLLTHGKEAVLKADVDRSVVEAAAGYLAAEDTDIGYLFSGWAQAALPPHRRLPNDAAWQVTTDRVTLIVQPGLRPAPDGTPASVGVPYGSRARLILLYLQTEAVRTNCREIELGRYSMLGCGVLRSQSAASRWRRSATKRSGFPAAAFPSKSDRDRAPAS